MHFFKSYTFTSPLISHFFRQNCQTKHLFIALTLAAVLHYWRTTTATSPCTFRTSDALNLTGQTSKSPGRSFEFRTSEYADDAAVCFVSREDAITGTKEIITIFRRFGMDVHTGTASKASKSVVLYTPPHNLQDQRPADLSPIQLADDTHIPVVNRFSYLGIPFMHKYSVQLQFIYLFNILAFSLSHDSALISIRCAQSNRPRYLDTYSSCNIGSTIDSTTTDSADVAARINAASRIFGALKKSTLTNSRLSRPAKVTIFRSIVLSVLFYGCESWALTAANKHSLQVFYNRCIRTICKTSKWSQRHLEEKIKAPQIRYSAFKTPT